MASILPDPILRFDRFALDPRQRLLLRDGEMVRLTPKAFDLLEILVSRANEVVPKSELVDRVWPDTFVSDTSLSKLVFTLRKELGEGPDGRPYIDTIPKRGYRFVANLGGAEAAPPEPLRIASPPRPKRRLRLAIGAAVAVVALAAASAAVWWSAHAKASPPERTYLVVMPFTAATNGDEPLARGISEFVTARLSTMHGISVMPPAMSGGASSDPRAVARQLGANVILQGTVQRTGERIGVVCRVVSLDEKRRAVAPLMFTSSDVFELEDRVAGTVATTLELEQSLRGTRDPALATPDRQQAYLRAIGLLTRFSHEPRIDDAIALLEPLAAPGAPPSPLVAAALGRAHLLRYNLSADRKDLDLAQSFAARATSLDAGQARVRALRGSIARARGELQTAAAEFQAALRLEPDANDILISLATTYAAMGQPEKAMATFDHIIAIHPLCAVCFDNYGLFFQKAGRLPDAIAKYQRAVALDPESANLQDDLGVAFLLSGRFREAVTALQKATTISRDNEVLTNLGYAEYLVGDLDAAAKHFAEAVERAPSDYLVWGNLGDALRLLPSRGRDAERAFDHAIALAREALQVNAGDAVVRAHLGEYLAKRGDAAAADKEIASALAHPAPQDQADIFFSAAAVAAVKGNKSAAVDLLERAAAAGSSPTLYTADPQFRSLRSEARFQALGAAR